MPKQKARPVLYLSSMHFAFTKAHYARGLRYFVSLNIPTDGEDEEFLPKQYFRVGAKELQKFGPTWFHTKIDAQLAAIAAGYAVVDKTKGNV